MQHIKVKANVGAYYKNNVPRNFRMCTYLRDKGHILKNERTELGKVGVCKKGEGVEIGINASLSQKICNAVDLRANLPTALTPSPTFMFLLLSVYGIPR
jgi:hypothetical protein